MKTVKAGCRVCVRVGARDYLVCVLNADLASGFTGRAFNGDEEKWEATEFFTYDKILHVID